MVSADATSTNSDASLNAARGSNAIDSAGPRPNNLWKYTHLFGIAAFAFLLASFPARNSDCWSHLAEGKRLVEGHFAFGQSANHTWLYDLAVFGLHSVLGGNGLVLSKAILAAAIALLLLISSRMGSHWGVPAFCCALAILAMGIRLLLQPATVSCLMLAVCVFWESRSQRDDRHSGFHVALYCLLFVVWANLDSWFTIGLATVALFRLGHWLDIARARSRAREAAFGSFLAVSFPKLLAVLAVLAAACVLNPAHVFAFVIPEEIGRGSGQVRSPFQSAYLRGVGDGPAGLAYFPLLGLGLLSFAGSYSRWHWRRFLPWFGLALLSVFEARAIPFFAVAAGPVTAWNLQACLAGRRGRVRRPSRFLSSVVRLAPVAPLFVLIAFAWPGWLQSPPYQPRSWAIETAPSLEHGAATTRRWLHEGKLGAHPKGLHLSPETARAFAWFCPEEKGTFDPSAIRIVLGDRGASETWLRKEGITHIIAYDANRDRLVAVLERFLADAEQWPLLYIEGDLAVFGWRDPKTPAAFRGLEFDPDRLAFHPELARQAPMNRPNRDPEFRPWWQAFWKPIPPRGIDRDEADLLLLMAEALRRTAAYRHLAAWENSQMAGIVAAAGSWTLPQGPLDAYTRLVLFQPQLAEPNSNPDSIPILDRVTVALQQRFSRNRDDSPSAYLYLAIRAARRALAVNPDDALAYLTLGDCYMRLLSSTRERVWAKQMPELAELRRAQASAALNQAVALDPKLARAHLNLGALYIDMGYFDLALDHQRDYLKLLREAGPSPGITEEQFRELLAQHKRELDRRSQVVDRQTKSFAAEAGKLRVQDRAVSALQLGLAGKAREILLQSDVAAFGPQGMALELELLLRTGRVKDIRDWTGAEQKAQLGVNYHWLRVQAFAASGDYALAEEECERLAEGDRENQSMDRREMMAIDIGQSVLDRQRGMSSIPTLLWQTSGSVESFQRLAAGAREIRQRADATVLRGLIALERGDVAAGAAAFRQALTIWRDRISAASGSGLDFSGRAIAQGWLPWLE